MKITQISSLPENFDVNPDLLEEHLDQGKTFDEELHVRTSKTELFAQTGEVGLWMLKPFYLFQEAWVSVLSVWQDVHGNIPRIEQLQLVQRGESREPQSRASK